MALIAGVVSSGTASASPWINPGTICHNKLQGEANYFNYQANGIVNNSSALRNISCPIITQNTTFGALGTVYVMYTSTVNTTCTLFTHNWNVSSLIATQLVNLPAGNSYVGIANVPNSDYYQHTLECAMPGSARVKIRGIEVFF